MFYKNIFKIALIYTGTILGAGFATGKELVTFFASFNKGGIIGFFISCFLLSLICMATLHIMYKVKANTYSEFMYIIFGRFSKYIEYFNIFLLFVLFSAMLAGGGATISNTFNININVSILIFCLVTFVSLIFGKNAIISINTILVPMLIIGGGLIGIYLYFYNVAPVFNNSGKALISPFLYTSYNAITTISVLFAIRHLITNKKTIFYSSLLAGIFIFIIGLCMLLPLIENYINIYSEPLPILSLIGNKHFIKEIYTFTVLAAIFTTAVSNGVALENWFKERLKINTLLLNFIILLCGVLFSLMGFSNIVNIVYPLFGFLGMFEIVVILIIFLTKAFH